MLYPMIFYSYFYQKRIDISTSFRKIKFLFAPVDLPFKAHLCNTLLLAELLVTSASCCAQVEYAASSKM